MTLMSQMFSLCNENFVHFPWLVRHREISQVVVLCEEPEGLVITDRSYWKQGSILLHGVWQYGN